MKNQRETWVDATKVLACVLVALGHFFQSMVKANIIDSTVTYIWFNQTIYYFHVPLFFLCSGYLYQKGSSVNTLNDWLRNVIKKLVALGVPFVVFSCVSWLLKTIFSADVNSQAGNLLYELFVHPAAPYWYLYTLFFVFLVTPTINNKILAVAIGGLAVATKGISILEGGSGVYVLDTLLNNWIWFVFGMILAFTKTPEALRKQKGVRLLGLAIAMLFFAGSVALSAQDVSSAILSFTFGIFGCSAVFILSVAMKISDKAKRIIHWMSDYTMPVYLMHTIFAAGFRSVLLKIGINNAVIHIMAGLVISFTGPILAAYVMKKLRWAEFVLYPGKFIKFGTKNGEVNHV